jgi:hypothetical protein
MAVKLGRLPRKENKLTLTLSKYLTTFTAPQALGWEYAVPNWPMMLNDQLGDCTCACAGHMIENWTTRTYGTVVPADQDILSAYEAVGGYVPGDPSTDQGCAITDVLNYWKSTGIAGKKILAWAEIDTANLNAIKQAIAIFGGIDIGFNVPQSAIDEFNAGKPWNDTTDTNIVGGHSVPVFGYGGLGCTAVTWAKIQSMSWAFWGKFVDEAYAIITEDWLTSANTTPMFGLDLPTLEADLAVLG